MSVDVPCRVDCTHVKSIVMTVSFLLIHSLVNSADRLAATRSSHTESLQASARLVTSKLFSIVCVEGRLKVSHVTILFGHVVISAGRLCPVVAIFVNRYGHVGNTAVFCVELVLVL